MGQQRRHSYFKFIILIIGLFSFSIIRSQSNSSDSYRIQTEVLKPDPAKEVKFLPYLAVRHGGMAGIEEWKSKNTIKYYQELWYYSESFYVKRNHFTEGITLDESIIDISRFESERKTNVETIVVLPTFKDVLVLLPSNKLVYKP